jgi:hypothetical protein
MQTQTSDFHIDFAHRMADIQLTEGFLLRVVESPDTKKDEL